MPDRFDKAIVIGDACVDVHIRLNDLIEGDPNKTLAHETTLGGTGAGAAVILKRLGVDMAFLGTVGSDYGGRYLLDGFRKMGIDTEMVIEKKELNTVNVFAFVNESGERYLWGFPRIDQAYCELDMDLVDLNKIKTASWVHSSGMSVLAKGSLRKALPELFRIAYEAGVPTSLDLNTRVNDLSLLDPDAVKAIRDTLPYVRYLLGSAEDEFVSFFPCEDYKDSVRHFASDTRTVIARNGKKGYFVISDGIEKSAPSYDVEVVDTTGAGDSFNAGIICKILEGKDVFEACEFANAVSASKISSVSGEITKEEVEEFMKSAVLRNCEE